jgi:uncharacterized membrane protein
MSGFQRTFLSGLPNLHPAIVHFPIALLPAAILFDFVLLARARAAWADRAAAWLYSFAAVGAIAAMRAGQAAQHSVGPLAPAARDLLHEHERLGERAAWLLVAVALLRTVATWRDRRTDVVPRGLLRVLLLAAGLAGIVLLVGAGDRGGRLVYRHGVGVTAPPASTAPATAAAPPAEPGPPPAGP